MLRKFYLSIFAIGLIVVATTGNTAGDAAGRQQLIDAMDAAWVRVLDDGTYRAIVNRHDMGDVTLNIVDCLPKPEVTPYPEKPEGTLRRILDEKRIKVGYSDSGETGPGDTALVQAAAA